MLERSSPSFSMAIKHEGEVTKSRKFSNFIASFQNTGDLKIYDSLSSSLSWTFKGHETEGFGLDMTKDIIATGSSDKTVKVWNLDQISKSSNFTHNLIFHSEEVLDVNIS